MADILRMDHINSLPQPFLVRLCGDDTWWPVHDFEVETALLRIDVCGLLQVKSMGEVMEIKDGDHVLHNPETFYADWPDAYVDPEPEPAEHPAAEAALLSAGRRGVPLVIISSTMPSPTWIWDLWEQERTILTESPPCEPVYLWAPDRYIDEVGALNAGQMLMLKDPPRSSIEDVRLAMGDVRRAYELQAAHYAFADRLLEPLPPAPTGKRYGPYDADPHTKGRRRRFRTQRKA